MTENTTKQNSKINCKACYEPIDALALVCPNCQTRQKQTRLMKVKEIGKWFAGTLTLISLVLGVNTLNNMYADWRGQQRVTYELINSAGMLTNTDSYREAWQLINQARELNPGSASVQRAQAKLSMVWLRNMVILKDETYSQFVDPMVPILARELIQANSTEAATIKAHLGWIYFLKEIDRKLLHQDKDSIQVVTQLFEEALADDVDNFWARVMWAYVIIYADADVDETVKHLNHALDSVLRQHGQKSEEYTWVRDFQWRTLKLRLVGGRPTTEENEAKLREKLLRIVNAMRINKESRPGKGNSNLIFDNYGRRMRGENVDHLLDVLPAQEHLKTFEWLFDEKEFQAYVNKNYLYQYKYIYARLLGNNGYANKASPLLDELAKININEEMDVRVDAAIEQLSGIKTERALAREARQYIRDEIPENADLWQFHADTLMNFEPGIISTNIKSAFEFFGEPKQPEINTKQKETYQLFKKARQRVKEWLDEKNIEVKKYGYSSNYSLSSEENAHDNYYTIWQLLGLYAFTTKQTDEAIAEWSDLYKLMKLVPTSLLIQLSKAYNKRADQTQNAQDKKSALNYLAEYIDAKVRYGGALTFDRVKNDPIFTSLHSNEIYIQLMQGR